MDDPTLDESRLRRLISVGRAFVQELDPESLLDEILSAAQELTGARYAALGILDGGRERLARFLTHGIDEDARRVIGDLPHGRGLLGVLIREPEPLRLPNLHHHPHSYGFPAGHPEMTTFLGTPIVVRGEAWGNLYLTEKDEGEFTAADEEALVILADWAAVAVENAQLYDRVRRRHDELERANQSLATATAIARAIGTETGLDRVLELVVKRGRALVDARAMMILLAEEGMLVPAAVAGEIDRDRLGVAISIEESTAGEVLERGQPHRLPAAELRVPADRFGVHDATSVLMVPMTFHGSGLGVLVAFDRHGEGDFSADDESTLVAVAASAATAVATAQSVDQQRLREALDSSEQERRRWARELHDETLQGLGSLQVRLSSALRSKQEGGLEAAVREVVDQVSLEIQKLRTLITELRPAALDDLGLAPAIESLARDVGTTTGLSIDVALDLDAVAAPSGARLGPEMETGIYRIVQEALTNVVKHAAADHAVVQVLADDGHVVVTVRDDGVGIAEDDLDGRRGFGVTGMRERVQLAGGSMDLTPGPDGGTTLVARLPVAGR
ncbi:two-component system sensor kinase [Patulibacter medicamentivorans]|uniref:Oxygen sensor histidine kinase NreB n=1 Tax=Patulibacter medicamentivorans TaxID=1097667 RepID=H0E177_9ACTN|nr:GAF domain-containing sensor histidine kinase [Patulibacter medicamentivorans]EHN12516.1 two-component system sensor kinase [Patulibacter medicamentivorans]